MRGRQSYQVRVREEASPGVWVKKSKFYLATGTADAANKYKGSGNIMWVQKVVKEKIFGIGEFFSLGDALLKEFKEEASLKERLHSEDKIKVRKRRGYYDRQRKTATN